MRVKILNELHGAVYRAKVIDVDTGEEMENVAAVQVSINGGGCYATIVVAVPEMDIETDKVTLEQEQVASANS